MGRRGLAERLSRLGPEGLAGRNRGKRPVLTLAPPPGGSPPPGGGHHRRRGVGSTLWLAVVPAGILLVGLTVYAFQTVHRPLPSGPSWWPRFRTGTSVRARQRC